MKSNIIKMLLSCLLVFVVCTAAFAQPEENGDDPPPSDVPLDGGTSILIATGVAYGVKKMRERKRIKHHSSVVNNNDAVERSQDQ